MADSVTDPKPVDLGKSFKPDDRVLLVVLYKSGRTSEFPTTLLAASSIQEEFNLYLLSRSIEKKVTKMESISFKGTASPFIFLTIDPSTVETMYVKEAFL